MLVCGIISSTGLANVQNQILNMFIIPFYNQQTDLKASKLAVSLNPDCGDNLYIYNITEYNFNINPKFPNFKDQSMNNDCVPQCF